jgi:ABC-type lipoprotein export system ATPase subunit
MLSVDHLVKNYRDPEGGTVPILQVDRFAMKEADQVVLRGSSGCGKTTFLNIIAGILAADSGTVMFDNTNISKLSEGGRDRYRAAKIGYVFQTFNLLDGFTALENVRLGMSFGRRHHDIDRAKSLLERVGLSNRMQHRPKQLSVGQQQRVSVARALANKPRLLLADEPTANVDPKNQQVIIDLMRSVCEEERVALLLVTHSEELSSQFSNVIHFEELNQVMKQSQETEATV